MCPISLFEGMSYFAPEDRDCGCLLGYVPSIMSGSLRMVSDYISWGFVREEIGVRVWFGCLGHF